MTSEKDNNLRATSGLQKNTNRIAYFDIADFHDHECLKPVWEQVEKLAAGLPKEEDASKFIEMAVKHIKSAHQNIDKAAKSLRSQFGK